MHPQKNALAVISAAILTSPFAHADKPAIFSLPDHVYEVAKGQGIYYLGGVWENGRLIEGYAFVHPRKEHAKPDGAGGGKGGKGGNESSSCFALMAKGARWRVTEPYIVDTSNQDGLAASYIEEHMAASMIEWDKQVTFDIFGPQINGVVDGADASAPDGKNEMYFGAINEPGVIAVTTVWGVFSGPARFRELVEWDQVYNDPDFVWGDATSGDPSIMDFANIAAHELGHAAGLTHPDNSCIEDTMYMYASPGETKKRDIEAGDISGIQALY
jgi:hypothetical protein